MSVISEDNHSGLVLEIQRLSTEDGPGIRTTVFMKGCPMQCLWCHNPESIQTIPQIQWINSRCIGCQSCIAECKQNALSFDAGGILIDRQKCLGCGDCASVCPANALELLGKTWKAADLLKEIQKDSSFFQVSGGGITISGGESTLQYKFVAELLRLLKENGFHTAIDTCGITSRTALGNILPYADLVLFDIKEMDPHRHREYTGQSLEKVLESLNYVCSTIRNQTNPSEIWIRTPIIPAATARSENIRQIGEYIQTHCSDCVTRWDLLAFNNLCKDKYQRLGLNWRFTDADLITVQEKDLLLGAAQETLQNPEIIHWSGSLKLEQDNRDKLPLASGIDPI